MCIKRHKICYLCIKRHKICYLCIKQPILLAPTIANLFWSDSIHSPTFANPFPRTRYIRPTFANPFPRTRYIRSRSHSPTFAKMWLAFDTFARVIRHFGEFGASGHYLKKSQKLQKKCLENVQKILNKCKNCTKCYI